MANRPRRNKQELDYAELHEKGFTQDTDRSMAAKDSELDYSDVLEDGQVADSPLEVEADEEDGEFQNDKASTNTGTEVDKTEILSSGDGEVVLMTKQSNMAESEAGMSGSDMACDDVWDRQQREMEANKIRREQQRRRLERQRILAQERLKEEQENLAIAKMKAEIDQLEKQRSVCTRKVGKIFEHSHGNMNDNKSKQRKHSHDKHGKRGTSVVMKQIPEVRGVPGFQKMNDVDKVREWLASTDDLNESREDRMVEMVDGDDCVFGATGGEQKVKFDSELYTTANEFFRKDLEDDRASRKKESRDRAKRADGKGQLTKQKVMVTKKVLAAVGGAEAPAPRTRACTDDGESCYSIESRVRGGIEDKSVSGGSVRSQNSYRNSQGSRVKSGFLDKPKSEVLFKLRWPHMNQNPRYVTTGLHYNQLTFPQFVGGGNVVQF